MDLSQTYQNILNEIQLGHRALVRFSNDELEELNILLETSLNDPAKLEAVLCVVEHSSSLYGKFEKNILMILNSPIPESLIIFALNCARKHIVEARFQKGQRLEYSLLEVLKKLLFHPNPEVVEWTLRLIESCGNQGVYFLREFDKIKPPPWKWFNPHQRAVREIITLLERRWSPIEKSKS
jgi:hypothetical protein